MNLHKMIAELQAEKQRLDEAIVALERLSAGKPRRRRVGLNDALSLVARERESRTDAEPAEQ